MSKPLVKVGDFCPNTSCDDHGKLQNVSQHHIIKFGQTPPGHQRYCCKPCNRTFVETKGTLFYRRRTPADEIIAVLALLAEGSRISSLARTKGHKADTILEWLQEAATHAEAVEAVLLADYQLTRGQIDGLWAYVGNKGEKNYPETEETGQFWRSTMVDMDTRLRVVHGIAKTETEASVEVFETLKARGHPTAPPSTLSDGWGGIAEAMVEVYGQVPKYKGRGRRPTRKPPLPGWQYVQMVKQRKNGRGVNPQLRVIYGDPEATLALLGRSTAYVEHTHLTMRTFNSRLTRKTLAFSKSVTMYRAAAAWDDCYYNWRRAHKSLRLEILNAPTRRWQPRSPAMAAELTDHIWTVKELLCAIVPPTLNNT